MEKKPIKITETVLRDAHQSLIATRMTTEQMLPIVDKMDKVGYHSVECWGGATFDASLRFLKEDPWERLRKFRDGFKNTKLQMLFRGQNILGYRPYADDVVEYFVQKSAANGIDIIRIFDCMNDLRNLQTAVKAANKEKAHAQVAMAYINLRAAQEKEALIKETLISYEETAKLATWKAEAGLGDLADAETARVQVKSAEVSLYQIQKSIAEYKNAISRLIATPNDQLPVPETGRIPTTQKGLAANIPASIMMQRPDIRGAIESLYSAAKGVQATKADFFPTLSLTGSIGTQAATVSALGASGTGVGALAAALSMPILNWGSLSAAKESAEASLDLAKANYRETLVTALEETDNALWAVKTTETSQKTMQEAVDHAKTAWQLAKLQYESGLGDYTQLLTTERNYLSTQENEINNRASMSNAYATLYRVLGGAWKARELSTEITK